MELARDDAHVELRISEKLNSGFRKKIRSWDKKIEQIKTLEPTGRFALFIEQQGGGQTELLDRADKPLEQQFEQIFKAISVRLDGSKARVAEWTKWRREREIEELERQERERSRKERELLSEEEHKRKMMLISEAEDWSRSELLSRYIAMLDARVLLGGSPMEDYAQWRQWVHLVANELDRSGERVKMPGQVALS